MPNNDKEIDAEIVARFGSFSKLRTEINNKVGYLAQHQYKGMDQGAILEKVVNMYNPNWKNFIHYHIHSNK